MVIFYDFCQLQVLNCEQEMPFTDKNLWHHI